MCRGVVPARPPFEQTVRPALSTVGAGRGKSRASAGVSSITMRILLVNPPHPSIGSRIPDDHLPPLGLLSIGGPLIDAGHTVKLLDADRLNLSLATMLHRTAEWKPDAVLIGHSGSTSAHPTVRAFTRLVRG